MGVNRRRLLALTGAAIVAPSLFERALADTYPSHAIRLVVGVAPGGAADTSARLLGQWLSERIGQSVVIEGRVGAGGNIATDAVLGSPPDGYTLLLVAAANAINATLYSKLNYNFMADSVPVSGLVRLPNVMVAIPSVPAKTIPEFIAYAKANPGKLSYASAGVGTASHMAGELFKASTGTDIVHIPYRGNAPVLTGLLAADIQLAFPDMASSIEHIKSGKLTGFGVTTAARSDALPDLPAIAEFVPGYDASSWFGISAPAGTPPEIVGTLNKAINVVLATPEAKARFAQIGGSVLLGSPDDFGKLVADETAKWAKVVKFSGAKAE